MVQGPVELENLRHFSQFWEFSLLSSTYKQILYMDLHCIFFFALLWARNSQLWMLRYSSIKEEQEMCLWNTDAPGRQQSQNMAKISKSYSLTQPQPQGHVMSVKCEESIDEPTVQVWLLYHRAPKLTISWFPQIMTYLFQGLFKDFWGTFSRSFQGLFFVLSNIYSQKNDQQWTFQIRHTETIWSWVHQRKGGGDLGMCFLTFF